MRVNDELDSSGDGDRNGEVSNQVAILMATYNGSNYLKEQIASLQAQTFTDWVLLVSDDGSTDETLSIVEGFRKTDSRIRIVDSDNREGTASGNFMGLLRRAGGFSYVFFCDQDDVWFPTKVEKELRAIKEAERLASADLPLLVFSDSRVVDGRLNVVNTSFERTLTWDARKVSFAQILLSNVAQGCTLAMNAQLVNLLLSLDFNKQVEMHDWWAMIVAKAYGEAIYLNEATLDYRQHGMNAVGASDVSLSSWVRGIVKDPHSLLGRASLMRVNAEKALCCASSVERQLSSSLSPDKARALNEIALLPHLNLLARLKVMGKYGLLSQRGVRRKLYWLLGILMSSPSEHEGA